MRYYKKYLNDRITLERPYVSELEKHAGQIASNLQSECKFQLLEFIGDECYVCICVSDQKGRFRITDIRCYNHSLDSLFDEYAEEDIIKYGLSYFENNGIIVYDSYYDTRFPELENYNKDIATALAQVELSHQNGLSTYIAGNFSERIAVRYAIQNIVGKVNIAPHSDNIDLKSKVLFSNAITRKQIHLSQPGITIIDAIKQRSIEVYVPNDDVTKSSCFIDSIRWNQLLSPNYEKCIVGNIECTYLKIGFEIDCFNNIICKIEDLNGHHKRVLIEAPFGGPDFMTVTHLPEDDLEQQNKSSSNFFEESLLSLDLSPSKSLSEEISSVAQSGIVGKIESSRVVQSPKDTNIIGPNYYVIDTNVFVNCPYILSKIDVKHPIILSAKVVDELDKIKIKLSEQEKKSAEKALRLLNQDKRHNIIFQTADLSLLPMDFDKRSPDNMILSVALKYKDENPIMLTSDNGLQLKCKSLGIATISLKDFLNF